MSLRSRSAKIKRSPGLGADRPYFRRFMDRHLVAAPSDMKILPLAHGTKAILLRDILGAGKIELPDEPCRTLGERLIFTFYGRPSYRINPNIGGLKRPASAPTYILLKPKAFESAYIAHPLDTGAFRLEVYAAPIHREINAVDFAFGASEDAIKKVVYYFFGSNDSYMVNVPRPNLNVPDGYDEAQAYYD